MLGPCCPSLVAGLLLIAVTLMVASGTVLDPNAHFFPRKRLMIFLLSGLAFGVAIFPRSASNLLDIENDFPGMQAHWIPLFPAWLWILIMAALTSAGYLG